MRLTNKSPEGASIGPGLGDSAHPSLKGSRFLPCRVSTVPPEAGPSAGERELTTGVTSLEYTKAPGHTSCSPIQQLALNGKRCTCDTEEAKIAVISTNKA